MADIGNVAGRMPPPPPRPIEYEDLDDSGWWLAMLAGIALVVVGIWMLTNLFESVLVLALLAGASLIVGGVVEVFALGGKGGFGWLAWATGGLLVATGVALIAWPDITLWAITFLAGATLLLTGLIRVVGALYDRESGGAPFRLGLGGLGIALGLLILAWPEATLVVLAVTVGSGRSPRAWWRSGWAGSRTAWRRSPSGRRPGRPPPPAGPSPRWGDARPRSDQDDRSHGDQRRRPRGRRPLRRGHLQGAGAPAERRQRRAEADRARVVPTVGGHRSGSGSAGRPDPPGRLLRHTRPPASRRTPACSTSCAPGSPPTPTPATRPATRPA